MPDELHYQRVIVTNVKQYGGYAMKLSHAYLAGIPDLLLKLREWDQPEVWEVKRVAVTNPARSIITINTTVLQRQTLDDMRKSGMRVGILVILPSAGRHVTLALTRNPRQEYIMPKEFETCHCVKTLNDTWTQTILRLSQLVPATT